MGRPKGQLLKEVMIYSRLSECFYQKRGPRINRVDSPYANVHRPLALIPEIFSVVARECALPRPYVVCKGADELLLERIYLYLASSSQGGQFGSAVCYSCTITEWY